MLFCEYSDKPYIHVTSKTVSRQKAMVEISWGKAFGYGGRYILYVIVWAIVGGMIMFAGGLVIASSINIRYNSYTSQWESTGFNIGTLILSLIIMVIGELVVILGVISSYFKLMSKLITETVSSTTQNPPPP
jgi:hypothetical protein